jgi:hypothetical protein
MQEFSNNVVTGFALAKKGRPFPEIGKRFLDSDDSFPCRCPQAGVGSINFLAGCHAVDAHTKDLLLGYTR